jgi:anti-sigma factor RsiW
MAEEQGSWRRFPWVFPVLVILVLALLGALWILDRQSRRSAETRTETAPHPIIPSIAPAHPPAAVVPPPRPLTLADVPAPKQWFRLVSFNVFPKFDFTIDLDYFASLGDGPANAAIWFRDFAWDGSRAAEIKRIEMKEAKFLDDKVKVYPPDLPLLLEAEGWIDQATCRFYPDVWKPAGTAIRVPSIVFAVDLARSWAARGAQEKDPQRAREDFRRAIRLGRLFMQDDMTLIQHISGLACISIGLHGLNDLARREGDAVMTAATSIALSDYYAMQGLLSLWQKEISLTSVDPERWRDLSFSFKDEEIERLVAHARGNPLRCIRAQSASTLILVERIGTRGQREQAAKVLAELARDPDTKLAVYVNELRRQLKSGE